MEVVQDCSIFFSYLDELCEDNPELSVQIINSGGDLIYPYKSHTSTPGYYKSVQEGTVIRIPEILFMMKTGTDYS